MKLHDMRKASYWLLKSTSFAARKKSELPGCAAGLHQNVRGECFLIDEYAGALEDLLRQGILQIIEQDSLTEIETILGNDPAIGPVDGLPCLGDVDFTSSGAELWLGGRAPDAKTIYVTPLRRDRYHMYSGSRSRLESSLEEEFGDHVAIRPIEAIGPWRGCWWERFPRGFRVEVRYVGPLAPG